MVNSKKLSLLGKAYVGILIVIFGGIVLHTPISVWLGILWPDFDLAIKAWKEILLLLTALVALLAIHQKGKWRLLKEPLFLLIGGYGLLHLLLLPFMWQGLFPTLAGLMIDLRYVLFFALVYIAMRLYPGWRPVFIKVGIAGALVVVVFALLQVFVLPHDVLQHIGYGTDTVAAYLTVDKNYDFIRINSTLRGPNPLGAYAGIVLALLTAALVKSGVKREKWPLILVAILSAGGIVALWASYSRSALIGASFAVFIVLAATIGRKLSKKAWVIGSVIMLALVGGLFAVRDSYFVSNILLHENPIGGSTVTSNEDHIESLAEGSGRILRQPFGAGVGSTGSASLLGEKPFIVENQYLFIAHEVGWLGLALFLAIFLIILNRLWQRRSDWLALGVFASGVGLALIGLLLPVWVDDTVSVVWWGLAGLALGQSVSGKQRINNK